MRKRTSIGWIATVVAAMLAGLAGAGVPAEAAPGCWATTCSGQPGGGLGCQDDAYVVAGYRVPATPAGRRTEADLWYSPGCHAAWGEYFTDDPDDIRDAALYWTDEYGGPEHRELVNVLGPGDYRTTMVAWDASVKFCAEHNGQDPDMDLANSPDVNLCSRWR